MLQPRESWRELEQQREELPHVESEQQCPDEQEQQHRAAPRHAALSLGKGADATMAEQAFILLVKKKK